MKTETFKVSIHSVQNGTIYTTIEAIRYSDARQMAESMYGGEGITIIVT
jgi:hypothetical protein